MIQVSSIIFHALSTTNREGITEDENAIVAECFTHRPDEWRQVLRARHSPIGHDLFEIVGQKFAADVDSKNAAQITET